MLTGSLDRFDLSAVLALVAKAGASGRLAVRRPRASGAFSFLDGEIVGVEVDRAHGGDRDAMIDAAVALLEGDAGDFSLTDGPITEIAPMSVERMLSLASKRRTAWAEVARELGDVRGRVALAPHAHGEVRLTPSQWEVIAFVDGERGIGELARAAGTGAIAMAKLVVELHRGGLVEMVSSAPPEESAPADAEPEEESPAAEQPSEPPRESRPASRIGRTFRMGVLHRRRTREEETDELVAARAPASEHSSWVLDPDSHVAYPERN